MMALQHAARHVAGALGQDSVLVRTARPIYERALDWLSAGRGIRWTINGADFRISPFQRHRMGSIYDADVAAHLGRHIKPGAVCFDVGANVGVYALQFARWTGPEGRVVAFEPNPVSARILSKHVLMNDFEDRVRVVEAAVADRPGVMTFHMSDADGMSRLGTPNPEIVKRTRPISVQATTLDDFCAEHALAPDWLLIDVEGFEFAVLAGARETIAERGHDLHIIVEMHPNAWHAAGWSRDSAQELLDELQLSVASLSGLADPLDSYGHVLLQPKTERCA